ncbi:adenylate/guanylate cyclase domain-containing protein [Pseudokineococcus basanitobsidens]|uniref:Adenylate/guanylate cyclase domain-containing protein n=1 Tax=Pseudokineococcus basanitobsidens TaxID=1926649 RepID=A0ABU8RL75_9ACTN
MSGDGPTGRDVVGRGQQAVDPVDETLVDEVPDAGPDEGLDEGADVLGRAALAAERALLGGEPVLSRREVATAAGVRLRDARALWRALGLPNVESSVPAFTGSDVDALTQVTRLVDDVRLGEELALELARSIGRTMDRLASWQVQLLLEETGSAELVPPLLVRLVEDLQPLVDYTWRRHLASALDQLAADGLAASAAPTVDRTVGFADIVAFTSMTRRLTEVELGRLVQRFEATAGDVVAEHGGRVITMIGDEVLFACAPGEQGAAIALGLAEAMRADPRVPPVRVGVATGRVVARLGDVFGTPVNRASRLTAIASPGTVLVDDPTASVLRGTAGLDVTALRERELRGLGPVRPWLLRRAGAPAGEDVEAAAADVDEGALVRLDGVHGERPATGG